MHLVPPPSHATARRHISRRWDSNPRGISPDTSHISPIAFSGSRRRMPPSFRGANPVAFGWSSFSAREGRWCRMEGATLRPGSWAGTTCGICPPWDTSLRGAGGPVLRSFLGGRAISKRRERGIPSFHFEFLYIRPGPKKEEKGDGRCRGWTSTSPIEPWIV